MAGSLNHLVSDDGTFKHNTIDNLGDSYEACEECFNIIGELAGWDMKKINKVLRKLNYPTLGRKKMVRHRG